jgi:hypothetical protein
VGWRGGGSVAESPAYQMYLRGRSHCARTYRKHRQLLSPTVSAIARAAPVPRCSVVPDAATGWRGEEGTRGGRRSAHSDFRCTPASRISSPRARLRVSSALRGRLLCRAGWCMETAL